MRVPRAVASALLLVALASPAAAQLPGVGRPDSGTAPQEQQRVEDPLGRSTPSGTITRFMSAVDREDYVSAARYLQLGERQRPAADTLARDLAALIDRYFSQFVSSISDAPDGALDDGLPLDREQVGPLTIGERSAYVGLVRVTDPQAGPIWLVSTETLAEVPELTSAAARTWIERVMPAPLLGRELLGISLAHWLVLAASLVVPLLALVLAAGVLMLAARLLVRAPARRLDLEGWYAGLRWPVVTVLALFVHLWSMRFLGYPLAFRLLWGRIVAVALVVALTWLLRRLLALAFARARTMKWGPDAMSTRSLLLLGERLLKAVVVLLAVFVILTIVGVDTQTALAGLGIGGVALALGAQRTVENLLGGVFLLIDRAIAVGDMVSIADRLGWVEDITLRSVRLRTLDQSLVSVPAGALAQAGIENFTTRHKILAQTVLRLRHGTSVGQLRRILDDVRARLGSHSRIETDSCRIRLVDFGERAIELELFAYVLTADVPEFLAIREELLLEIAAIVEAAGSGFAQPTEFIHVAAEPEVANEPRAAAPRGDGRGEAVVVDAPAGELANTRSGPTAGMAG